jgi:hypothetical protein
VSSIEVVHARDRSAEFEEEATTQHENRMTERTMEDQALAAASADAHRTELESINLPAGDSGSGQVEGEDPAEPASSVSASERETWARGNALRARSVSFASLPVNQREQTDCLCLSLNPVSPDVATMFTQLMASQKNKFEDIKLRQQQHRQEVAQFTRNQQNLTPVRIRSMMKYSYRSVMSALSLID